MCQTAPLPATMEFEHTPTWFENEHWNIQAILAKWLSVVYELSGYEFQSPCSYLKQLMLHLKKIITKTYINTYSQQCYVKFLKSLEQ